MHKPREVLCRSRPAHPLFQFHTTPVGPELAKGQATTKLQLFHLSNTTGGKRDVLKWSAWHISIGEKISNRAERRGGEVGRLLVNRNQPFSVVECLLPSP